VKRHPPSVEASGASEGQDDVHYAGGWECPGAINESPRGSTPGPTGKSVRTRLRKTMIRAEVGKGRRVGDAATRPELPGCVKSRGKCKRRLLTATFPRRRRSSPHRAPTRAC